MLRQDIGIVRTCLQCAAVFTVRPSWTHRGKFCSRPCWYRWKTRSLEQHFWDNVGKKTPSGCVLWIGKPDSKGYARVHVGKKSYLASRVSYQLMIGPIPDGLCVLHHCDNPMCINPMHFFLGTRADNNSDKLAKGRQSKGADIFLTKLTEDQVREIRQNAADGIRTGLICAKFDVSPSHVRAVVRRKVWKHVT